MWPSVRQRSGLRWTKWDWLRVLLLTLEEGTPKFRWAEEGTGGGEPLA